MQPDRVRVLNDIRPDRDKGSYVLYWMQQSQRAEYNHALEHAVSLARELDQPCLVGFGLSDQYPDANVRGVHFMLSGLKETAGQLAERGIKLVVKKGSPDAVALQLAKGASSVVCDRGYLRHQKAWRKRVAAESGRRVVEVESDVVVPVEQASDKREYAARTIRKKLQQKSRDYLETMRATRPTKSSLPLRVTGLDLHDIDKVCAGMDLDRSVGEVSRLFAAGTSAAKKQFRRFLDKRLADYSEERGQPQLANVTHMSMYLHFGQISPLWLANETRKRLPSEGADALLEELVVRRELAVNFVRYTSRYDEYSCLPEWARETLEEHQGDPREHRYTRGELEAGETHDPYWNAAMKEMRETGYMHNHMRMYWGKQILAWCNTPRYAYRTALYLNNKYFLDGRDANSFANVGWVFGLHDRPWGEREVFGKVRCMTRAGLERKCNPESYVDWVEKRVTT